jgi:archaemetzincin
MALQPIQWAAPDKLRFVQQEMTTLFHRRVYVLPDISMPVAFQNLSKGERYSADSLLSWLSGRKADTLALLVGLTGKDIFTTKRQDSVWGIFGLGYCPGIACVVSDHRLGLPDGPLYDHRLRTIVAHEIGHNLGLPHCPTPHCIMNDANERIATVDGSAGDFCAACRRKLPYLGQQHQ